MEHSNPPISNEDARAALETINQTSQNAALSFRPPIWLVFVFSFLVAAITYSTILSGNNSVWTFISIATSIALVMVLFFLIYRYQSLGIRLNYIPRGLAGKMLTILQGVVVAALIIGGKELYQSGITWVAYLASIVNFSICGMMLYYCPTGSEFIKDNAK